MKYYWKRREGLQDRLQDRALPVSLQNLECRENWKRSNHDQDLKEKQRLDLPLVEGDVEEKEELHAKEALKWVLRGVDTMMQEGDWAEKQVNRTNRKATFSLCLKKSK